VNRYEPFKVHRLNQLGIEKATELQKAFEECLAAIEEVLSSTPGDSAEAIAEFMRCRAPVVTKMQEASFFAKRAVAVHEDNQERG
jgi:hypothetical protein